MPSDQNNPFQAPQHSEVLPEESATRAPSPVAILVVVIIAGIGAGATFFVTCLGVLTLDTQNDAGIFLCMAASFFGFLLFARLGVIVANGFSRNNMALSWLSILAGAISGTATFVTFAMFGSLMMGLMLSTAVCTFVIWRLHKSINKRSRANTSERSGF